MVVTAFLNEFSRNIAKGIGDLFSNAGIHGRSSNGNDNQEGGGNIFTNIITRVLDPEGSGNGGGGMQNTIQNLVLDNLTVQNLNTFKDLLRSYWGKHKGEDEEEVRKDLDIIKEKLGYDQNSRKLAKIIDCVENDVSDEDCGLGARNNFFFDDLPEYDQNDDINVRNANEAATRIMKTTQAMYTNGQTMDDSNAESFAVDVRVNKRLSISQKIYIQSTF